jgi:cytochrome c553
MKKVIAGLVIAVGISGLVQAAGNPAAGQEKSAICAGCHGADGNSTVPNFPKLAGQSERYTIKQLQDIKTGVRIVPEMTGMLDNLNDQDFADLAAFYKTQQHTVSAAVAENLELGEQLYRAGNLAKGISSCAGCHSPSGQGNSPAGFPALGGQHAAYLVIQLKKFRANERVNDGDTRIMRDIAMKLSDDEIAAVSNYISGLHP